ncbi:MAG: hypothetical protein JWP45_1897 [Mucilaginibacter sp.]|jgi:tetratricopeptide (TPR) repeat protein|nr:hypothetical protein [Mucilaginibacter sp.]
MKIKFLMAALLGLISVTAFAQKGELTTAQTEYNDYLVSSGQKLAVLVAKAKTSLGNAKTSIDKASTNSKTAAMPLTFALKAAIYSAIAKDDSVQTSAAVEANTAMDALKQAKTLDTKNENAKLIDEASKQIAQYEVNRGVAEFQNKKYDDAYKSFDIGRQLIPTDTTMILNTAIAAANAKNYKAAEDNYNSLLKLNYNDKKRVYNDLPGIYLANKDTAGAIKSIDEALVKYPDNPNLRRLEIEIALQSGKLSDLTSKLQSAIAGDPKNKVLYYYAGLTNTEIGDAANDNAKKLKDTDPAKKATYQTALDNYAKAGDYFKKALEIDPDYYEANRGYGYALLRPAIDDYNKANQTKDDKEYAVLRKKANVQFDLAKPYIQKAVDINPKSADALTLLRNYYKGKYDPAHAVENAKKADDLKKQIDALPAGGGQ